MKLYKEDKKEILAVSLVGLLGLGLSILFFYLYNHANYTWLTIVSAVVSYAYMSGCIFIYGKDQALFQYRLKWSLLLPIIYTTVIFLFLLFIEQKGIPENPSRVLDCLLWAVYTMPAFIIVIALALLVLAGLAYGG